MPAERLVGLIREFEADIVMGHRPFDYHPDHRNVGILLQDRFQHPEPFRLDVIVPIDDVYEQKIEALHHMPSQFYEWLPWVVGVHDRVPQQEKDRRAFLKEFRGPHESDFSAEVERRYGEKVARTVVKTEAFQLCEYGSRPSPKSLTPCLPNCPPG